MKTHALLFSLLPALALAQQSTATCDVARPLDGQRLLRRLSLDLRGHVPSYSEQATQSGQPSVSASVVDAYLASTDFTQVMRRYHQNLLWPNIDQVEIAPELSKLRPTDAGGGVIVWFSFLRGFYTRTVTKPFVPCSNQPAQFNADGTPKMFPLYENGQVVAYQEGWVTVAPYWDPQNPIKVCALDAQTAATAPMCTAASQSSPYMKQLCDLFGQYTAAVGLQIQNMPAACNSGFSFLAQGCGCGPNLRLCTTPDTEALVRGSMLEQELRLIDDVVGGDQPYTQLLLTKKVSVNGYLAHWLNYQSQMSFNVFGEPDATSTVPPQLNWQSGNTWVDVQRTGRHSGVLTTPGYLLKYQSNRGRAHRFYNAFECASFLPQGALPSPQEACSQHQDLTQRCGCNACHTVLEPMASHWGRFAEYGMTPLDETRYPTKDTTVCTNFQSLDQLFRCFRFYKVQAVGDEVPFQGDLIPYVFRTADEVANNIEVGPSHLANQAIESGAFATCTTRKMWAQFMRRQPTADEEATVIPDLAAKFEAGGYHLKSLVKAIVTNPAYGRMP